jgi:CelD/BcsL family acetyltransferase involved in cellulose biosynthesis
MGDVAVIIESGSEMLTTAQWERFAAAEGTPFHSGRFLLPWWQDRQAKNPESQLFTAKVVDDERVVGICAFELDAGLLSFAGGHDVVDYMGPAASAGREKEVAAALAQWLFEDLPWTRASLAGLVQNDPAAQAIVDEILRIAPTALVEPYDQAPRIDRAPQGYLALLNSKRRADILRKRSRLVEAVGELELVVSTCASAADSLDRLLVWKAEASPATGEFVAEYGSFVRAMVAELAAVDAVHVVELHAAGRPLASAILLSQRDTALIYNMAYDLNLATGDRAGLAPGVVLVSLLVERTLDDGRRFDFLKGAQDYKLRLGGVPVDLIGVTVDR